MTRAERDTAIRAKYAALRALEPAVRRPRHYAYLGEQYGLCAERIRQIVITRSETPDDRPAA